jgi:hypothetical protein
MKQEFRHSRREFIEGALFAGAAFAFNRMAKGEQNSGNGGGDSGTPFVTERIEQPDNSFCTWVGFSPVNDQTAYVSGIIDKNSLYVSRAGQPEVFDLLWEPTTDTCVIKACAWSPNGKEIAFLAQAVNEQATPKSGKISIYVVDVATKTVREPVIIAEATGQEEKQHVNVSYKKGLSWWNDSCVCVPADKTQGGGVMKFDTHTGESEKLNLDQNDTNISEITKTRSGELRFIKTNSAEQGSGSQFTLCSLAQDGTIREHVNLTQQFGAIMNARLSQDGDFIFAGKGDMWSPDAATGLIYKIDTRSVIGQIPLMVRRQKDTYTYIPLTVRNSNELILIEVSLLAVDGGGSNKNITAKAVKKML